MQGHSISLPRLASFCCIASYLSAYREFSVYVETHTSLFHPDHRLTVVEGGREEVREVDTRRFVLGNIDGKR